MKYILDIPITYPNNIQRTYDLIIPNNNLSDIPLLIWIHGGGWIGGEKRIANEFERFSYRGYAILSIDYRFSHEAVFPAQLEDCKMAVRWARANAKKYGYNADTIIVGGNSAGGHLAALLGITNGQSKYDVGLYDDYSSDVQAVVDLFGPSDLRNLPSLQEAVNALVNSDENLAVLASPVCHDLKNAPDFFIVHGTEDFTVPIEQSRKLKNMLCEAGVCVEYLELQGEEHGFDCVEFYNALNKFILNI